MTELTKTISVEAYENAIAHKSNMNVLCESYFHETRGTALYDFDSFKSEAHASRLRRGLQGVVMTSLALVLCQSQAEAENEQSRPVAMSAIEGLKLLSAQKKEYPEVDFHEPLRFSWSKDDDRIREAAKKYLENKNADH